MRNMRGLTLLELVVTVAIVALVLGVGVPGMRTLIRDAQLSSLVSTYMHGFNSARYLAVTRHRQIALCVLNADNKCTGKWAENPTLFFDDDRDGTLASRDDLIEQISLPAPEHVDVTFRAFGNARYVSLRANGHYRQNGTFRFCPRGAASGRAIVINVTGRTRSEKIACPAR